VTHLADTFVERLIRNVRHELDEMAESRVDGRSTS
jgi:hypothetical protein